MSRYWYFYQQGSETDPLNYIRFLNVTDFCVGGTRMCAMYSRPNSADPLRPRALSTRLHQYIIAAEGMQSEFPVYPNKPYVYTQPAT